MVWKDQVYLGGKPNGFYRTNDKHWHGFWVIETQDPYLDEIVTFNSIEGCRSGRFEFGGKVFTWKIEGSPSLR